MLACLFIAKNDPKEAGKVFEKDLKIQEFKSEIEAIVRKIQCQLLKAQDKTRNTTILPLLIDIHLDICKQALQNLIHHDARF